MRNFRRLAVLTTAATYVLIFIGGLVRVSGAGLGCPDWPTCFGRWIPPTAVSQLPPDIDPSAFNFTLAWIEYLNRLSGMAVGLLIAWLAILAIIRLRNYPRIVWPAITAAILTAIQGWQGATVVASELQPLVVTVHMVLALVIVSLLVWVSFQAYREETKRELPWPSASRALRLWSGLLWGAVIVQVALGTQVRQTLEFLAERLPLLPDPALVAEVGLVGWVHTIFGLAVAVGTWLLALKTMAADTVTVPLVKQIAMTIAVLGLAQVIIGLVLFGVGLPPVTQVLHMWLASLLIGLILLLFAAVSSREERV